VSPSLDQPVRGVSWYDAVVFCLFSGGRLPTKQELTALSSTEKQGVWEWSQSWYSEEMAHIAVARQIEAGEVEFIGVNPDLRLPEIGFRIIRQH
jgi:formylglycine-generating enzyme required for sulfatase activity